MTLNEAQSTLDSTLVLASAADLTANIILKIAGNDVSNSLNGTQINRPLICAIAQTRISQDLIARAK